MLSRDSCKPALFQMVNMESLVPSHHVLRKIDAVLDLSLSPMRWPGDIRPTGDARHRLGDCSS